MAGRVDPSRDLRFGLRALESGAVDREQLISAIREWALTPERALAEVLAERGVLTTLALDRLEEDVKKELALERGDRDPSATMTYAGRPGGGETEDGVHRARDEPAAEIAGGRFQILRAHDRGGLGEVFVAHDRELNRSVALKELLPGLMHDTAAQNRFLLEAEVTGRLEHPGIVPVYSLGRHRDGRPYYAMHLVEGETLRAAIDRFYRIDATPAEPRDREVAFRRLLRCVIDACNAVAYAHSRGVIHRDLKPENIMLGPFGETLVVDWGLAKRVGDRQSENEETGSHGPVPADTSMTQPGSLLGTPRFMSPEQAAGNLDQVSELSDVYSLGAILYCVLVGHEPFQDGDLPNVLGRVTRGVFPAPRRVLRSVDPALEAICLKAMALQPRDRHATALELASEVETWLADVRYRDEHATALNQAQATLARLCLERAHRCFDRETRPEGMLWLARALENAPGNSPDLERVIRANLTGWHAETKLLERSLRHGCDVSALAFCPEGRRLATACGDRSARLWDLATGSALAPPLKHKEPVVSVAFSPDGTIVASTAEGGVIRRWNALTGEPVGEAVRAPGIGEVVFSPDGSLIAAPCGPGTPMLWSAATGKPVNQADDGPRSRVLAIAFSPDGTTIAVTHDDGRVCFHDGKTGLPRGEPLIQGPAISLIVFDESGEKLLTASVDGAVCLWEVRRCASLVTVDLPGTIRFLSFRPGCESFATVGQDGTARLWESATGRPIGEPLGRGSRVDCLAFRPDGTMLATGSPDGMVRLWCAVTALPIGPPLMQGGSVRTLRFSADGRRLATGGSDSTVRCWKLPSPVEGNAERVSCWVGVATEMEFDAGDAVRRIDGTRSWDLRRRLGELGGAPVR